MDLIDGILWLRKLGIGRSLNAIEIVSAIDNYLFSESDLEFKRDLLLDDDGNWLLSPLLPENESEPYILYQDLYPFWCKGFDFGNNEEVDLSQFHAIESFVLVSEVIKYLLTPRGHDGKKYLLPARSVVSNLSPEFRIAGACFNRALKNPDEIGTLLVEDWANNKTYEFASVDHEEKILRFSEIVICIANMDEQNFYLPLDLPPWQESEDFLQEIGILDKPSWRILALSNKDISQMKQDVVDDVDDGLLDEFESWFRVFNFDAAATDWRWCYYFWDNPYDASVWNDNGFDPFDAALWNSINYDTFDVLKTDADLQTYATIAPMARAGIPVTDENIKHWGDAEDSVQIILAIDQGFPNIEEYQKYKVTGADYSTICKFLEHSKEQLSIQDLARAIALQQNGRMSIQHSIAWSKIDQSVSDVVNFRAMHQSPAQASKWIDSGIQLDKAIRWVTLGLSEKDALLWTEKSIDTALVAWFLERKIKNPNEASLWLKYLPKTQIDKWHEAGFDPISASDWRELGFGAEASLEWLNQGVHTAKEASEWTEKKFDIKEAIQWRSHFISPENAQKWREKEVSPEIAQRREQAGIKP